MTHPLSASSVEVVSLGEALIDLVGATAAGKGLAHAETFQRAAGGAPANVAVGAARLGVRTGFIGKVGADPFGDYLAATLRDADVDVTQLRRDEAAPTALALVSLAADGEREFVFYPSSAADTRLRVDEVDEEYLRSAKLLHVGSISLIHEPAKSATIRAVEIAEQHDLVRSFDPNLRLSLWPSAAAARTEVLALVPRMNVIKVNAEELAFLTGGRDEVAARRLLIGAVRLVLITDGPRGVSYLSRVGAGRVPSPVVKAIDTTGAGDAFVAALLAAVCERPELLPSAPKGGVFEEDREQEELESVLWRANAYAALTTTRYGAIPALPSAYELDEFLAALGTGVHAQPRSPAGSARNWVVSANVPTNPTSASGEPRSGSPTAPLVEPRLADVEAAQQRIAGVVRRTPLLQLPLEGPGGHPVYAKPENLQITGSFKMRGALNFLASLGETERQRGVVAWSSGNHAQGVAAAAKQFGVPATIVLPDGAPEVKVRNTAALGAKVVRCANTQDAREGTANRIAQETGATLVPPYDHPWIVAGQGTIGLEIYEDLPDVANVIVPIGGGGLAAGVALALRSRRESVQVIGAEPLLAADAHDSLLTGERRSWSAEQVTQTLADGVRTQSIGALNFTLLSRLLAGVVTVDEAAIAAGVPWYASNVRLIVEPTGGLSWGAFMRLLAHGGGSEVDGLSLKPGPSVLIISGGNVDAELFGSLWRTEPSAASD